MINILRDSIEEQFFTVYNSVITKRTLPATNSYGHLIKSGKGLSTDGLIFTPVRGNYIIGSWRFCSGNTQYKWKPIKDLTIDMKIGPEYPSSGGDLFYYGLVRNYKEYQNLHYTIGRGNYVTLIKSSQKLVQGSIYECNYVEREDEFMVFNARFERFDKTEPNSIITALSVLDALDLNNNLRFLSDRGKKSSVLDLVLYLVNNNWNEEIPMSSVSSILNSFSREHLIRCIARSNPLIIFGDSKDSLINLIDKRKHNSSFELEFQIKFGDYSNNYKKYF